MPSLTLSFFLLVILHLFIQVNATNTGSAPQLQNITVPITSTQITYTPFVCNTSTELTDPQRCAGAWQLSNSNQSISTTGPTSASGDIIPQLFFEFQASSLYLYTVSTLSNATVNLTLSAGGKNISTIFNSSLGVVSIVDLPPNQTTLLTITYISATGPTLFDLDSFIITTPMNTPTNSMFPTQTLPPSASLPSVIPPSTSSGTANSAESSSKTTSNKTKIGQAVGITVGLGLGLTALAVAAFYYWKRRKRHLGAAETRIEEAKSEWSQESFRNSRLSRLSSRLSRLSRFRT